MDLNRGPVVKRIQEEVGGCDVKKKVNPEKREGSWAVLRRIR